MTASALAITGDKTNYSIAVTDEALRKQTDALELSRAIKAVTTAEEQQDAVAAAGLAKGLIRTMEETREAEKRPFWDACVLIDSTAKNYKKPLLAEAERVQGLAAGYQREQDRIAAEAKAAQERQFKALREADERALRDIAAKAEAERRANLAAIAAAQEDEAAKEAAQRKADADAAARSEEVRINQEAVQEQERERFLAAQALVPARTEGARVKRFKDYQVMDMRALYLARPDLVELTERRAMILAAISIPNSPPIPGLYVFDSTKLQAKAS